MVAAPMNWNGGCSLNVVPRPSFYMEKICTVLLVLSGDKGVKTIKMEKIKFFSVAVLATTMALNFTSCSSDDDNNAGGNNVATQKYIIHRTYEHDNGNKYVAVVSYDSKNRPIKIIDSSQSNDEDIISIDWQNNKIDYNGYSALEFKINEQGFITEIIDKNYGKSEFTYSNGVLIKS